MARGVFIVVDVLDKMAALIREDPSITAKDLTKKMGYHETKSIYYWLYKAKYPGIREFKRAVLAKKRTTLADAGDMPPDVAYVSESMGRQVMTVPIAERMSPDGTPVWSSHLLHLDLPGYISDQVFAVKTEGKPREEVWVVLDPSEEPNDGSIALVMKSDQASHLCKVVSFGPGQRRYISLSGEEETKRPTVLVGVVKAILTYL